MMRRGRYWYLIATLGLVANVRSAGAIVLCAKKSGAVVARAECKRKEMQINPGGGALRVVDSKGEEVGKWITPHSLDDIEDFNVGRSVGGRLLLLFVSSSRIGGFNARLPLLYTNPSCSGPAYVEGGNLEDWLYTPGFDHWDNGPSATRGYYAGSPIQSITLQSYADSTSYDCSSWCSPGSGASIPSPIPEDTGPWCCCIVSGVQDDTGPLTALDLTQFTPPFSVQ